jgi:hypothetical protein
VPADKLLAVADVHNMVQRWYIRYDWYMSFKRTNVYADPDDLALIKEAAAKRGISEAEIIRHGIHLAAMSTRVWGADMDFPTFDEVNELVTDDVTRAVVEGTRYR